MELYAQVRRSVFVEGLSEREAAKRFGLARETVRKMLRYATPPAISGVSLVTGDVDGDGTADILVAATGNDISGVEDEGQAFLWHCQVNEPEAVLA